MEVYRIETVRHEDPILVIASSYMKAIEMVSSHGVSDTSIVSVERVRSCEILTEEMWGLEERLRRELQQKVQEDMPQWHRVPDGIAGGVERDLYLIRYPGGSYATSKCIGGTEGYYLELRSLEKLPGLPEKERV